MKARKIVLTLVMLFVGLDDVLRSKPKPGDLEAQRSQVEVDCRHA